MDLIFRARDYLRTLGFKEVFTKRFDVTTPDEGVYLTQLPFVRTGMYFDGSVVGDYQFEAIVRNRSEQEAMETCNAVSNALDEVMLASSNGSYAMVSGGIEIYREPQELYIDECGLYNWAVAFTAHVKKGKSK